MPSCLILKNQIQLYNIYYYLHQKLNHQGGYMEEPLILTIKIYDKDVKQKIVNIRKKSINITNLVINAIKLFVI